MPRPPVQIKEKNRTPFVPDKHDFPGKTVTDFFSGRSIVIGFPRSLRSKGSAKYPDGTNVVDVAIWNNFGTKDIPARPFMQRSKPMIIENTKPVRQDMLRRARQGQRVNRMIEQIGAIAVGIVQRTITQFAVPPNAPSTIRIKGVNNPLIDTGLMRKCVTWEVRNKD